MYMGISRVPPSLLQSDALGYFIPNKISTIERLKSRIQNRRNRVPRFRGRYATAIREASGLGFWQALLPIAGAYMGKQSAKEQKKAFEAQARAEAARAENLRTESGIASKRNLMILGGVGLGGAILLLATRKK